MSEETRRHRSRLAMLGRVPAFTEPLHVGRPNFGDRDRLMAEPIRRAMADRSRLRRRLPAFAPGDAGPSTAGRS